MSHELLDFPLSLDICIIVFFCRLWNTSANFWQVISFTFFFFKILFSFCNFFCFHHYFLLLDKLNFVCCVFISIMGGISLF